MKFKLLLLGLASLTLSFLNAQSAFQIKDSQMTIEGTSSLHDWVSNVTEINAKGMISASAGTLDAISKLTVEIPVTSIKSPKGKVMDNKTYGALKANEHPTIEYELKKVTAIEKQSDGYTIKAAGNLTIAGAPQAIDLTVKGKMLPNGDIHLSGSKKLKMTDFQIDPPTALMGTLKTGDDITIKFSLTLTAVKS